MKQLFALFILIFIFLPAGAQKTIPLYPGLVPNSISVVNEEFFSKDSSAVFKVSEPSLTIFLPEASKNNGTAIIICPGGGYRTLVIKREGYEVARELNKEGITAFVLKYRLPDDKSMKDKSIGPLQDAQQAIKIVRQRAAEWNINKDQIGIMGFSAGGHLAATAGTHFQEALIENKDGISLRPDFMILVYPVISFKEEFGHKGTREALIGKSPNEVQISNFSNEIQVTSQTPPAFLIHGGDDHIVPVENSLLFFEALRVNKIPASIHIYENGEHGFLSGFSRDSWLNYCKDWLRATSRIRN